MLGLRYLVCPECDAVHAVPERLAECDNCGAHRLEPLRSDPAAAAYFVGDPERPEERSGT